MLVLALKITSNKYKYLGLKTLATPYASRTSIVKLSKVLSADWNNDKILEPVPLGWHVRIRGKVLNAWGILYAVNTYLSTVLLYPFMLLVCVLCDLFGDSKVRSAAVLSPLIHMNIFFCAEAKTVGLDRAYMGKMHDIIDFQQPRCIWPEQPPASVGDGCVCAESHELRRHPDALRVRPSTLQVPVQVRSPGDSAGGLGDAPGAARRSAAGRPAQHAGGLGDVCGAGACAVLNTCCLTHSLSHSLTHFTLHQSF